MVNRELLHLSLFGVVAFSTTAGRIACGNPYGRQRNGLSLFTAELRVRFPFLREYDIDLCCFYRAGMYCEYQPVVAAITWRKASPS